MLNSLAIRGRQIPANENLFAGGEYCDSAGLSQPSGPCVAGYYCTAAAVTATPAVADGYGGHCVAGQFCPAGSDWPTVCTAGHFCAADRLNATSGVCEAGYYCTAGARVSNPTDGNVTGKKMFFIQLHA